MESTLSKRKPINKTEQSRSYYTGPEIETLKNGEIKKIYQCKICKQPINGTKGFNLFGHLKSHKEVYEKIFSLDVSIEERRLKLLLDCVELITVNGKTFTTLNQSGFISIVSSLLNELEEAGRGVNLTDPNLIEVKSVLQQTANSVKQKIREELNDTPLTLMVDITTKRRRSILGASIQFIVNNKQVVRSIGMLELKASHAGEYLAKIIFGLIKEYDIKPQHVIAITTDNGANVLKMVRDLATQMDVAEDQVQPQRERTENIADAEIENYLETVPDITDEEAFNLLFQQTGDESEAIEADSCQDYENLLEAVVTNLGENESGFGCDIVGVHCSEHTLQLCISDAITKLSKENKNVIELARRAAKTLRLKSTIDELEAAGVKFTIPHIEVVTRWSSKFMMVCIIFN